MKAKGYIPNLFTSINLISGCLGIIEVFEGRLTFVPYYIWISVLVDFLDGFSARLIGSSSEIGKDLDSLADLVSFGVLPSLVIYSMLKGQTDYFIIPYLAILIAVFSALRLAKFNNDTRQSDTFYGLPVPANALLFSTIPLMVDQGWFVSFLSNPYCLVGIVILFSLLMVSDIKLLAFKFKNANWKGNEARFLFIAFALVLLMACQYMAIPFIVVLYIIISVLINTLKAKKS